MARLYGICGGSGAGKTTLAVELTRRLGPDHVSALAFDAYYRDLSHLSMEERMQVNYDHPDSLDHELFATHLADLRAGRPIEVPEYDFATHTRTGRTIPVEARDVVIVEGILLFCFPAIHALLDHAVFIDVPEPVRLERRIRRDVAERGRDADDVRRQFAQFVAPMHDEFVQPHRDAADRVVDVAEDLDTVAGELAGRIEVS
ncbi:MAG: uridine kinase [Acidimicrobiales bacterium]|nr:uridine kinase [Acidimicrobiales bacterium]